jgi:cytochrome c-type biogenesis protein CcmF
MTLLGNIALWVTLLLGVWGAFMGFAGGLAGRPELARSALRAVFAVTAAVVVASIALLTALLGRDFNVEYVAAYTSRNLPIYYTISAFWAGQKGSLLFWALIVSIFMTLAVMLAPRRDREFLPYVAAVCLVVVAFFASVMLFASNPFERLAFVPQDGSGLNPQLQNPGMTIHPPMLYLGYTSITIPFAFAIGAMMSRRLDVTWLHAIRRWTLLSWLFLAVGIVLGMWWAYVELGWGGYWAWDPVENASFLPWLVMTAFLHSVMIQEKRGMLKKWNLALIIGAFLLSIFGTFITRSGVISSVHSFTQSNVGFFFLGFLIFVAVASFWLYTRRLDLLKPDGTLESMVSREAGFLFNNLLLVGIAFSVLWGTLFPILSEWVRGTKVTVGPPFFNQVNIPLGLALLALTGIGPLIAWRRASVANLKRQFAVPLFTGAATLALLAALGVRHFYALVSFALGAFVIGTIGQEFARGTRARHRQYAEGYAVALMRLVGRNRRRYGGYIVHLGIVMLFVAFAGMAFRREMEATLKPGESAQLASPFGHTYTFTHLGVSQYNELNRLVSAASVDVRKNDKRVTLLTSEKRQHVDGFGRATFEPSTEVAIKSDLLEDLYIVYAGSVAGTEQTVYRFTINPLVWWVWAGGFVLVIGGLIAMWPGAGSAPGAPRRTEAGYGVTLAAREA